MKELRYVLVSDGFSDQILQFVLTWLLQQHLPDSSIISQHAFKEMGNVFSSSGGKKARGEKLTRKIVGTLNYYSPFDILFVHRDAENDQPGLRVSEIRQALSKARLPETLPAVCVVPIKMTESWFLFDEMAIRTAANNPHGKHPLDLPPASQIEAIHAKLKLYDLLRQASGLPKHRQNKYKPSDHVYHLAETITDFTPLRQLAAFQTLESDLQQVIKDKGWN